MKKENKIKEGSRKGTAVKVLKTAGWCFFSLSLIWIAAGAALEFMLSPETIRKISDRYAPQYIDGRLEIEDVSISPFRYFPNIGINIENASISYTRQEQFDTLASFGRLSLGVNLLSLIKGEISIPHIYLSDPCIHAIQYPDGSTSLDIIKLPEAENDAAADEDEAGIPEIRLGRVRVENLHACMIREGDSLDFKLDRLGIRRRRGQLHMNMSAVAEVSMTSVGDLKIPIDISGAFSFPKSDAPAISIKGLKAEMAGIPIEGDAKLVFGQEYLDMKASARLREYRISEFLDILSQTTFRLPLDISTDASLSLGLECDGKYVYSTGELPGINASLVIPESELRIKGLEQPLRFQFDISAQKGSTDSINVSVKDLKARCNGLDINTRAELSDILSEDPEIKIDGKMHCDLKQLRSFLPDTLDLVADGQIEAEMKGSARMSHMDLYSFSRSDLQGWIKGDSIIVSSASDSLDLRIDGIDISLGPQTKTSRIDTTRSFRLIGVNIDIDAADLSYASVGLSGNKVHLSAMNTVPEKNDERKGLLGGRLSAEKLKMTDASGMEVQLKNTANGFQMMPQRNRPELPVLTLNSSNAQIALKDAANRAILTDAKLSATAVMNTVERRQKARNFMDSLAKKHPEVPRDSLMSYLRARAAARDVPEWMKEEDFRKQDLNIKLDETLAKYFREWNLNGKIDIRTGILMTPYFPIRNILRGFKIGFDNDKIVIDSMKVRSGSSDISAKGKLSGLRRALLGRGILDLDMDIRSDKTNADELLAAYAAGSRYVPPQDKSMSENVSDAEFFKMVTADTLASDDSITPLIVIPSNLNVRMNVDASDMTYSDLNISRFSSSITMKERCVQISDTKAVSNVGDISLQAFYSTRTKEDIKAGFSIDFKDITAEKVIGLMPAVDTLMPLLKSFNGQLDCEVAATADLDSNMNIVIPSVKGVMRIEGNDLSIKDSKMYQDLAKKLLFKNKKEGYIEKMSVEGAIDDSRLEVFPFIVKMDRYTLALSGIQNMDQSFRYHASLIRSPFLIKLGVDLYGDSFDKMKFKIGKAKYKSTDIPVFSSVIDTTKLNLVKSIRNIFEKGVDAAVRENQRHDAIERHKQDIGYIRAVDQELEGLSEKEKEQMEAQEAVMKETEAVEEQLSRTITQIKKGTGNEQSGIH